MASKQYERPVEGRSITREVGGKVAPAGLWRHKDSGQEAIVQDDPLFGNAQAQAFLQTGFEFIRPAEPGEVKTLPELAAETRTAEESNVKGLAARLDVLEQSNADTAKKLEEASADNQTLAEENAKLREQLAEAQKTESAAKGKATKKAKADAKTAKADKAHIEDANTDHDAAVESGDAAKADAERVVDDRESESADEPDATVASPDEESEDDDDSEE